MILPQFVVMENVMGLTTATINGVKGQMPKYIINRLEISGYQCSYYEVNSADYGAPQCRKKSIISSLFKRKN